MSLIRLNYNNNSKYDINTSNFYGYVIDYKYDNDKVTFILKGKEKLKCNYYINENNNIDIKYGDKLYLKGKLKEAYNNTIPNTFNYKKYLKNNDINYILTVNEIIDKKSTNNIILKIKNYIQKRINNIDNTGYLSTFILGNKNYLDDDAYNSYKANGIIHIFSISGMHISLLTIIILKLLNTFKKSNYNIFFVIIFLIFYLILTNYQASILRSIVFFIMCKIFNLKKINIKTNDILLISISLILLIKPNYIFNVGFLYSSIISYVLIYFSKIFNKNYILNTLLISLISFLFSLPITINNNYSINLLSIFINLIFVPLVSFILYPLSLIVFLFPILINIFKVLIKFTELISNIFYNIKIFNLSLPKMNFIVIILYYLILLLSYNKNKKYFILLICLIISIKYINYFDNNIYVYYIDVGQGDMELLKYKNNSFLIDTGVKAYNDSYEAGSNYITFFKSIGIYDIDTLILTHGDADHIGNANYLVNNFKIKKVIFNCDEFNELETDLINILENKNIKYYTCIKELNFKNNKLYFLNTKHYDNENDNSNVIYTQLYNYKFLFMGDASLKAEENIIKQYNIENIDVLKVGHHGSKTSSSKKFIDYINPKYSIISVGKKNMYGHPNKEALDNLKNTNIYRTDLNGSILFKINNNKIKIETYEP